MVLLNFPTPQSFFFFVMPPSGDSQQHLEGSLNIPMVERVSFYLISTESKKEKQLFQSFDKDLKGTI